MSEIPQDSRLALGEILGSQKYIAKQMEDVLAGFKDFRQEMRADHSALVARVTRLEQFHWKLIGLGSAGTVVVTVLSSLAVFFITKAF